ncbi:MAG: TSUP family transporter [Hyphomicrobiales bacterium]|nr:TSUP family transporter [Hyphomicrobiales bacterium]
MSGLEIDVLMALFAVGLVAACFDAIAGGGGLLTLPALLLAGMSPVEALGTNKLQSTFGSTSSSVAFVRRGHVDWRIGAPLALSALIGSMAGALCAKLLPREVLEAAVPVALIVIGVYFLLKRGLSDADAAAKMPAFVFGFTIAPLVGFYDGVFGPGAGSFYMVGLVSLLGFGVMKATAHTKLANAGSNWGSLFVFALGGTVAWGVGLLMGLGALIGAQIGSRLAMRLGARLIRPLLVTICFILAAKLLSDPANPLRTFTAQLW